MLNAELDAAEVTEADWQVIADRCRQSGYSDVCVHLMAAMTVRSAIRTAAILISGSGI